ncbi:MAG: phosphatidylserine/phosphatidylglycerophosphate/cardiolipin synthase family protein [bacterium]
MGAEAMKVELLIGADEFWSRLRADIEAARSRVLIQAMTFEGDSVGLALAEALSRCRAPDRRLLVDAFSKYKISDRFALRPTSFLDPAYRAEYRAGLDAVRDLRSAGVGLRYTNPVGPLLAFFPARNHKKMMLIDGDVAYIGGINFSEHNFSWHDMMLRVESPELTEFLAQDFRTTWEGRNNSRYRRFGTTDVFLCNGAASADLYERVFAIISGAARRVVVYSPYVSFPLIDQLQRAASRGVAVTIISSEELNSPLFKSYLAYEADRLGFELLVRPGRMSHLKAMLLDDRYLVAGSSNFDIVSYRVEQELITIFDDPALAAAFKSEILEPDLVTCRPAERGGAPWMGRAAKSVLMATDLYCRVIGPWVLRPAG